MKTIGIIGGMSFESTVVYYRIINAEIARRLGGLHSAKIILSSLDFAEIEILQRENKWDEAAEILSARAKNLQNAGADFIIIATNTMHKLAPQIRAAITIPLLHIAEPTIEKLKKDNIKKVALIGTKFTMEENFYKEKLKEAGLEVFIPDEDERKIIHEVIFKELCLGKVKKSSEEKYQKIINDLKARGAQAVILGCTEICMLLKNASLPLYDTTLLHALAAADKALEI